MISVPGAARQTLVVVSDLCRPFSTAHALQQDIIGVYAGAFNADIMQGVQG